MYIAATGSNVVSKSGSLDANAAVRSVNSRSLHSRG